MVMSRTIKWDGMQLTKADLLEFLGEVSGAPDDLVIDVSVEPRTHNQFDAGGLITLSASLPREHVIQRDGMVPGR